MTFLLWLIGMAFYAGAFWLLLTPKGRRWAGPHWAWLWVQVRQRCMRPERSGSWAESWLRAQRLFSLTCFIYASPCVVAVCGALLVMNDIHFHVPFGTLFLMLLGRRITWMMEEVPQVHRFVQGSYWANAQRMVNDRHKPSSKHNK